jgi:hypothetical protein
VVEWVGVWERSSRGWQQVPLLVSMTHAPQWQRKLHRSLCAHVHFGGIGAGHASVYNKQQWHHHP